MTISLLGVTKHLMYVNEAMDFLKFMNPRAPIAEIDAYYKLCPQFNINLDAIMPQMWDETGFMSSARSLPPWCNMAGIGATDDGAWGSKNKTYRRGIQEHIGHFWAYAGAYQHRPDLDDLAAQWDNSHIVPTTETRFHYVRRVKTPAKEYLNLTDLSGNWATNPNYGTDIENNFLGSFIAWKKRHT